EVYELDLEVEVTDGAGASECAGVIVADPARKYYGPVAEVEVSAESFTTCCVDDEVKLGYRFVRWDGDALTNNFHPVQGSTAPEINMLVIGDQTLTAVYEPERCGNGRNGLNVVVEQLNTHFSSDETRAIASVESAWRQFRCDGTTLY